jgi:hypothetical protein
MKRGTLVLPITSFKNGEHGPELVAQGGNTASWWRRRGASVVEFAVIAPLFLLLLWAIIEFGRLVMVEHALQCAAIEAARTAVIPEATEAEVLEAANRVLTSAGLHGASVQIDPTDLSQVPAGEELTIRVSLPSESVRWLPFSVFANGLTLTAQASMVREGVSH